MNWIDLILLGVFAWAAIRGYMKGFIVQAAALGALLLGILGAVHFSDYTANLLTEKLELKENYIHLVAFALTFIAIVIGIHLLARIIDKLLKAVALGTLNRLAGVLFSIAKMVIIVSVVLFIISAANKKLKVIPESEFDESKLYKPVLNIILVLYPHVKSNWINTNKIEEIPSEELTYRFNKK